MKSFPYEFAARKSVLYHPAEPDIFEGDILEIGPGRGDILLAAAEANPDKRFVAIEIKNRRFHKLARRVDQRGLQNVLLIRGDARIVLPDRFGPETLETIYVLFPDPWPKRRHTEMRLLNVAFLKEMAVRLKAGGQFVLATDALTYRDWVTTNLQKIPLLEPVAEGSDGLVLSADWEPTFYEMKWRSEGRTITYLTYRRVTADRPGNES